MENGSKGEYRLEELEGVGGMWILRAGEVGIIVGFVGKLNASK